MDSFHGIKQIYDKTEKGEGIMEFKLHAPYEPTGDQPQAIEKLVKGFKEGNQFKTLLGVTGSGKTFTMANVIQALNKPTLIISHTQQDTGGAAVRRNERIFPGECRRVFCLIVDGGRKAGGILWYVGG